MFNFSNPVARIGGIFAITLALLIVLFPFPWVFLETIKPPELGATRCLAIYTNRCKLERSPFAA